MHAGDPGPYPREDREAARQWLLRWWPKGWERDIGFTGNLDTGDPGETSVAWKEATLIRLNSVRRMVGLQPVALRDDYTRYAQAGALILGDAGPAKLSHAPTTAAGYRWITPDGFKGCQGSDLGYELLNTSIINDLLVDSGVQNLGHRAHLLKDIVRFVGLGSAPVRPNGPGLFGLTVTAIYTNDFSGLPKDPAMEEPFICWPARGFFPKALMPNLWSIDVPAHMEIDTADASVELWRNGVKWPIAWDPDKFTGAGFLLSLSGKFDDWTGGRVVDGITTPLFGYENVAGEDCFIGESVIRAYGAKPTPGGEDPMADVEYKVRITGLKVRATGALWNGTGVYEYTVNAFSTHVGAPVPGAGNPINLSTRAFVGDGQRALVGGFVVGGTVSKRYLLRAAGSSLATFGVAGAVANPRLTLHRTSGGNPVLLASNEDWDSDSTQAQVLKDTFASTGAYAWKPGSKEAALLVTLAPGSYTATVEAPAGQGGVGLVEIYDADSADSRAYLVNLSTRAYLDQANPAIAGFVLGGTSPRSLFIRATSKDLKAFGIQDTFDDPRINLFSNGNEVFSSTGYSPSSLAMGGGGGGLLEQQSSAEARVGAFAANWSLDPNAPESTSSSTTMALLPECGYTVVITPFNNADDGAGIGLMEIYVMP